MPKHYIYKNLKMTCDDKLQMFSVAGLVLMSINSPFTYHFKVGSLLCDVCSNKKKCICD